jgi:hypothetical protein
LIGSSSTWDQSKIGANVENALFAGQIGIQSPFANSQQDNVAHRDRREYAIGAA